MPVKKRPTLTPSATTVAPRPKVEVLTSGAPEGLSRSSTRGTPAIIVPSRTTAPKFTPSPEQQGVYDWVRNDAGHAFVEAVAGSGKTSTLVHATRYMRGSVALTAFAKAIADELKPRVADQPNCRVGTCHSVGLAAWKRYAPSVQVDANAKERRMLDELAVPFHLRAAVAKLTSLAKQSLVYLAWAPDDVTTWKDLVAHFDVLFSVRERPGVTDEDVIEELVDRAQGCVAWARQVAPTIVDFDDMIWAPLIEDVPMQQYDWVLVDEAQDTNLARRLLAERMMHKASRSLWVGDRFQSIFGFTGADNDAVDQIVTRFNCKLLPLTVTFRCSKAATQLAQTWVPHIQAHEANKAGLVLRHVSPQVYLRPESQIGGVNVLRPKPGDAILCRNTRPLVSLAFKLIRAGVGAHVEGREIGKSLEQLATRWAVQTAAGLAKNLEAYRQREIAKAIEREAPTLIEAVNDRVDTLLCIMEGCSTVDEVRSRLNTLFQTTTAGQTTTVTLATAHKAKGREWNRVFIAGFDELMPSPHATQPWQQQQERNLQYVAVTRTRDELITTTLER